MTSPRVRGVSGRTEVALQGTKAGRASTARPRAQDESVTDTLSVAPSFEAFFQAEHTRLFRALVLVCGKRDEAEDVMQEAFLSMWQRWDVVSNIDNPPAYLHRTDMNYYFRASRRIGRFVERSLPSHQPDDVGFVEVKLLLWQRLRQLPERQRAAFVLVGLLGYDSRDAANILGIQAGTARTLVARARTTLRDLWPDDDEDWEVQP